ncbi:hypothetical protein COLO4_05987 [Corchorus olitorius]|uniref:Uncharacterized protein n=1 Tax=Corchorus olitorius TaxID=93759 RepID=A0A1R3KPE1_9ROSI|nr:hypothetical protein COLO4_05987 [Corchorus olitorius]
MVESREMESGVSSVYIERWEERENSDGLCEGENGRVDSCLESEREDESKVYGKDQDGGCPTKTVLSSFEVISTL